MGITSAEQKEKRLRMELQEKFEQLQAENERLKDTLKKIQGLAFASNTWAYDAVQMDVMIDEVFKE